MTTIHATRRPAGADRKSGGGPGDLGRRPLPHHHTQLTNSAANATNPVDLMLAASSYITGNRS